MEAPRLDGRDMACERHIFRCDRLGHPLLAEGVNSRIRWNLGY